MANIDGLPVNSAVTHAEFMSRTEDTSTTGSVNFQNVTESTSSTTGAIKTAGGLGVAKSLNVGLDAEIGGTLTVQTNLDVNGVATVVGTLNTADIAASGNINTTLDMSASNILAVGNVEAQTEMITPLLSATVADVGTLNLTNAFTAPSLTVTTDATINGNLTVNGTTVTLNTATVDSEDPNITVNKTGNDASSEGAGFTVDRTGTKGSLVYANALASKFKIGDLASEAEVVTVSHTQTLTNKTLTSPVLTTPSTDIISATEQGSTPATPASGVRKLYPKADGFYQLDSTGLETKVGSGSGGGGVVNLITNGSADDASASIFTPYVDAAGARPVDGTGGSPTVTTSVTSTNPLVGTKSYLLTKPASNTQGQGWAVPFTVDLGYRAKVLNITVDYIVNSGTFVAGSSTTDSDVIWYLYDITNSQLIEPSSIKMLSSSTTLTDQYRSTFQTSATGSSYRLLAHCATTSALAYEIKVDNITVSPSVYVYGTPITDMVSVSTVTLSSGTNVNLSQHFQRREGDHIRQRGLITWNGAGAGGTFTVSLGGYTIDTNKINSSIQNTVEGYAMWLDNGTARKAVGVTYNSTTAIQFEELTSSAGVLVGTGFASGDILSYEIVVPILGLSSSVQMSDGFDGRVLTAKLVNTASQSITNDTLTTVQATTVTGTGGISIAASGVGTVLSAGWYTFQGRVNFVTNATGFRYSRILKNSTELAYGSTSAGDSGATIRNSSIATGTDYFNAGDTFALQAYQNSGASLALDNGGNNYLHVQKVNGPSAIAASESINAVYTTAAGQSIPNATDTIIDFGTSEIDNQGRVTTGVAWKFTANISGIYEVSAYIQFLNGGAWNTAEDGLVSIFKNGTNFTRIGNTASTATHGTYVPIPCAARQIRLLAGDYIDLRAYQTSGSALGLAAASTLNWVSIKKVGN